VTELPLEAWPSWLLQTTAALIGATVGSFLNVVIARLPAGQSVVTPRSRCPRCGRSIAWYDNLPVLSWLLLRARCRGCREPISIRYPLVELAGGVAGWLALQRHGPTPRALAEFTLVALLLALAAIDLDTWLLPHRLTWPLIALGLVAAGLGLAPARSLASAALGGGLGFGAFALVSLVGERLLKKEALGFGDVFLLGGLGAWFGAGALLPVVLLASLQGSVVGLALILIGRSQPGPAEAPLASPPLLAPAETPGMSPLDTPATPTEGTPEGTRPVAARQAAPVLEVPRPAADADLVGWVPPRHALPFGPFLVAGALEWLWLGERLGAAVPLLGVFR
jgi:leader peptidase (prepilin peptidase)/N-methyltransferase